jgi:hypothetical protein
LTKLTDVASFFYNTTDDKSDERRNRGYLFNAYGEENARA